MVRSSEGKVVVSDDSDCDDGEAVRNGVGGSGSVLCERRIRITVWGLF